MNGSIATGVRQGLIGSAVIVAIMLASSGWVASRLPEGAQLPTHWNLAGKVDGYGSPAVALWLMPPITFATALLMAAITKLEPRRAHLEQSMPAYVVIWLSVLLLFLAVHVATLASALGHPINMMRLMMICEGLLFIVIGNYLGKLRSNFFAGVRTPWTLSSELSWNKTHRLAGKLFVALGVISMCVGLIGTTVGSFMVLAVGLPVLAVWTVTYSYVVWKHDPERETKGASPSSI